jgi:hypothetical protein
MQQRVSGQDNGVFNDKLYIVPTVMARISAFFTAWAIL